MNPNINTFFKDIKKILTRWGFSKKGLINNSKGEWYLFLQILLIILHFLPPYPSTLNLPIWLNILCILGGVLISVKGLIIVLNAFIDLGENLTPLPYPMKESILVKDKSYKHSRHPLYKGILYISLGICIFSISILHLFLLVFLVYILRFKALKEEERLKIKFPEYKEYTKKVPAIIKGIKYLDW